jgi:hypothetical protein
MSFKRLHQKRFDCQHDGDEGESIGQDAGDVEQLKGDPDLEIEQAVALVEIIDSSAKMPSRRNAGS